MKNYKKISNCIVIIVLGFFLVYCQNEELTTLSPETESQMDSPQLKSTSTSDYLMDLIQTIENMVTDGLISEGNANALIVKINNASKSLAKGNSNAFDGQLVSVTNQVESFVADGTISEEDGEMIINKVEASVILSEGSFIDERDGNKYSVVLIGEQLWMAENLAYLPAVFSPLDFSVIESRYYVYGYDGSSNSEAVALDNYRSYGVLYNWKAAMEVCPTGWHLPSSDEWNKLAEKVNEVYGPYSKPYSNTWEGVGRHLKSITGWEDNGNGTNELGFSALAGGEMFDGYFASMGNNGDWWSTSEFTLTNTVWRMGLNKYDNSFRLNNYSKSYGLSIRCIKD